MHFCLFYLSYNFLYPDFMQFFIISNRNLSASHHLILCVPAFTQFLCNFPRNMFDSILVMNYNISIRLDKKAGSDA